MMTADEIEDLKEGGRRKILRVRFPYLYGLDDIWILRTLLRAEIFEAYETAGYPEREIPEQDPHAQILMEDKILTAGILSAPDWFVPKIAPAGIASCLAKAILLKSNFVENTSDQQAALERAFRYANSTEGRGETLVLHYLPAIRKIELDTATYEEMFRYVFQAMIFAKCVEGQDIDKFLSPDGAKETEPPEPVTHQTSAKQPTDAITNKLVQTDTELLARQRFGLKTEELLKSDARVFIADPDKPVDWHRMAPMTRGDAGPNALLEQQPPRQPSELDRKKAHDIARSRKSLVLPGRTVAP